MTDKDTTEIKALNDLDMDTILCQFHLEQTLNLQVKGVMPLQVNISHFWELFYTCQHCNTEETLEKALKKLESFYVNELKNEGTKK